VCFATASRVSPGRRDGRIARTMRKPDRTRLPALAALLLSSDLRLARSPRIQSRRTGPAWASLIPTKASSQPGPQRVRRLRLPAVRSFGFIRHRLGAGGQPSGPEPDERAHLSNPGRVSAYTAVPLIAAPAAVLERRSDGTMSSTGCWQRRRSCSDPARDTLAT
jgi:hypothetical protein